MIKPSLHAIAAALALLASSAGAQARPFAPNQRTAPPPAEADTAASEPASGTVPLNRIVAVVGDQPILMSDALEAIAFRRARGEQIPTDSAAYVVVLREAIDRLVDVEVLVQKAKAEKVEVPDDELTAGVDAQVKRVRDSFQSESEYRAALRTEGFGTPDEYRRYLLDQSRREAVQQRLIEKLRSDGKLVSVAVTEDDVTKLFKQNQGKLPTRPATIGLRQIVIAAKPSAANKAKALAKAESLLVEIRKGGDFEQIAKRESMDPGSKELGGDLGWNRRGRMVKEFDQVMFALPPGTVSPIIETAFGYHIIRVDRVRSTEVKARHILIRPQIDSNDVAAARKEGEEVLAAWRAGANFDSLAAKHHDIRAGEERNLPEIDRSVLPPTYTAAIAGKGVHDFVGPFEIADPINHTSKFVVAQITALSEGGAYTVADFRNQIRDQLAYEKSYRRLVDSLRKNTYVSVRI